MTPISVISHGIASPCALYGFYSKGRGLKSEAHLLYRPRGRSSRAIAADTDSSRMPILRYGMVPR